VVPCSGYFCFASGLGLGCGIQLGTLSSWAQLWDAHVAARVAPTLASCFTLMWVMARHKHPAALPLTLLAIVALFHGCLAALGVSLEEAQQAGWLLKPAVSGAAGGGRRAWACGRAGMEGSSRRLAWAVWGGAVGEGNACTTLHHPTCSSRDHPCEP
jgi:SulP family sulfate permease